MLWPEDCALAIIDIQEKLLPPIFEKNACAQCRIAGANAFAQPL
jgi:hypothetical protein